MEIMDFIVQQALVLMPALYILGMMLKNTEKIEDWLIPWILTVLGVVGAIAIMGFNINAIIQGILVTGVTVYGNQLLKQTFKKKNEDKPLE